MLSKTRTIFFTAVAGSLAVFPASSSWAAATVCVTVGVGSPVLKLAVASNFYGPAQTMAQDYITASGGSVNAVLVCQNSTSHLYQEILNGTQLPAQMLPDPGFPRYDYFFAANQTTPVSLQPNTGTTAFLYAMGVPVLYSSTDLNPAVTSVGDLITGLGSATHATITSTSLGSLAINSHAQYVGVADPTAAPYGLAAENITTAMGYAWVGNTPPSPPLLPSLFANVDLTFSAVGTTVSGKLVGSAFVGKSQICPSLASVQYVEFTGFLLGQYAIQLDQSTGTIAFNNYLMSRFTSDWNAFLVQNCYQGLPVAAAVPVGPFTAPAVAAGLLLLGMVRLSRGRKSKGSELNRGA